MMNEQKQTQDLQPLSALERANYERLLALERERQLEAKQTSERMAYYTLVDKAIEEVVPKYLHLSTDMKLVKSFTLDTFRSLIEMKRESLDLEKKSQFSYTFTHSNGDMKIKVGMNILDIYRDSVNEGVEIVTNYVQSLSKDVDTENLVSMVMKLLARDSRGNLKPTRVLELRQLAEKNGDKRFLEGVRIIEESHMTTTSSMYVQVYVKNDENKWTSVPLSITDVKEEGEAAEIITGITPDTIEETDESDTTEDAEADGQEQ